MLTSLLFNVALMHKPIWGAVPEVWLQPVVVYHFSFCLWPTLYSEGQVVETLDHQVGPFIGVTRVRQTTDGSPSCDTPRSGMSRSITICWFYLLVQGSASSVLSFEFAAVKLRFFPDTS